MKLEILPMHLQDATGGQRPLEDFSRQELSLCLDVLARIIHSREGVEILRPDEHTLGVEKIRAFRDSQYRAIAPYLASPFQQEIETKLDLDARSLHFIAVQQGEMIGTLRITDQPFEISALSPELTERSAQLTGYKEISRLVIDPKRGSAFVGEKLLFGAVRWLCAKTDARGFIMICRERRLRYFSYYGLTPVQETPFRIPERENGLYYLMSTTFPILIDRIFSTIYWNPEEIEKRYRWTRKKN